MRKKNATDLLRFYGGDIREKTEDGIMTRFKRLHREKNFSVAFRIISSPMQKNTQNILEKLQEKVIMSKMTHLIKYKQIFYQIINENAGDVVNGTAAYVYQPDDP